MTKALIAPPMAEPLTLAEIRAHLRIDHNDDDAMLANLAAVARNHLETALSLCLMTQGWRLYLDDWPQHGIVELPLHPVLGVTDIRIYDGAGNPQAGLVAHELDRASRPARLFIANPLAPGQAMNGIEIDFSAGFGDSGADVPDGLKRAMLTHVALMYEASGAVGADQQPAAIPDGWERLVAPFRLMRL